MVGVNNFRKIVLSFKDVEEQPHFEKTSFRVNKKIVATLDVKTNKVVVKLSNIEQSVFGAFDHTIIYPVHGAWGKQGWTIIELDKVTSNVLKDALNTSYNHVMQKNRNISKTKKNCNKGHTFYKSSECPVCPICEKEKTASHHLFSILSAPARRALEGAGIKTLQQLSKKSKTELLALHGMGQTTIPKLQTLLKEKGLSFSEK